MKKAAYYIGIMSGTSLDGVDLALVSSHETEFTLVASHFLAYPETLKAQLLTLHNASLNELEQTQLTANTLSHLYAEGVHALLANHNINASQVDAIGNHGQTIRHRPELGFTLQIVNNALLAELTQITVVGDFRSRDIAAGGQGAPLVPAFHQAIFGSATESRAIINIGGIANITYLPTDGNLLGFDSGPGNMLLDSWMKLKTGKHYDANGAWAATGVVHDSFLNDMLAEPYFTLPPPKSTGRDLFNDAWLKQHTLYPHCRPEDIARTLVELTAHTIHQAIERHCPDTESLYICGGGAHNQLLIDVLAEKMAKPILKTDRLGIDADWVEAVAFAWLAQQTILKNTSNSPSVTGAKGPRILGAIYQS